jgi:GNAT superfamily N-acetyltransferase
MRIWKSAFEDSDDEIEAFYRTFGRDLITAAEDLDGEAASAGYAAPVGWLNMPGGDRLPCAMIYAVATLPEARGRGLAAGCVRKLVGTALGAGYSAVVLRPARDDLFGFYERRCGFREMFVAREHAYAAADLRRIRLTPRYAADAARPASPAAYRGVRQALLGEARVAYVDMDERALEYQRSISASRGGGLFTLETGGAPACVCAERSPDGSAVFVKELVTASGDDGEVREAVRALSEIMPAREYRARIPRGETGGAERFGMIYAGGGPHISGRGAGAWYGLAFE